jgi:predicted kinase
MGFYVIVRGLLGVGKTAVSKRLAAEVGAEYISIDRILEDRHFWESGRLREFLRAHHVAAALARPPLSQGVPVIVDGNFSWKTQLRDLTDRLDFPHVDFTLTAPLSVCIARDLRRAAPHGGQAARKVYAKPTAFEYGISVDATVPIRSVVRRIRARLSEIPLGPAV